MINNYIYIYIYIIILYLYIGLYIFENDNIKKKKTFSSKKQQSCIWKRVYRLIEIVICYDFY
jgi:hypothetical protein